LKSAGCFIVCILLTLICLVPLYIMIVNACRGHNAILQSPVSLIPGGNFVENMKNITTQSPQWNLWLGYRNSLIIAAGSTILTVFFSAMTAYGLTVYQFKVRDGAYTLILAVMMIPIQVTSTGFVQFMVGTSGLGRLFHSVDCTGNCRSGDCIRICVNHMKCLFPIGHCRGCKN